APPPRLPSPPRTGSSLAAENPAARIGDRADGTGLPRPHTAGNDGRWTMAAGLNKVVIVGGGAAALAAGRALLEVAQKVGGVEVVALELGFTYRPLLVAEPFGAGGLRTFPLRRLTEAAGATLVEAGGPGLDSAPPLPPTPPRATSSPSICSCSRREPCLSRP